MLVSTQAIRTDMRSYSCPHQAGEMVSSGVANTDSMMWVVLHCVRPHVVSENVKEKLFLPASKAVEGREPSFLPGSSKDDAAQP